MITRELELEIDGRHYEVKASITDTLDGLQVKIERATDQGPPDITFLDPPDQALELVFPGLVNEVGRAVDDDRAEILLELEQAAHDAAVDSKISERKERHR